jgi:cytidylate kinase
MIITIDGTSASGKTTAARELARRLGFELLRTGAMYRALALAARRAGFDHTATEADLAPHLEHWIVDADGVSVWLNGADVSHDIDGDIMSNLSSSYAEYPAVRRHVTESIRARAARFQREGKSFVAEGRDQGSFVFPDADCKFYIDASLEERARRRKRELHHQEDVNKSLEQLMSELQARDARDAGRVVAPLCVPAGAMVIDNSTLTKEQVVQRMYDRVLECRGGG